MKIYFDKLYKDDRIKELCGICVPFKKGALTKDAIDTVTILDVDRKVPSHTHITSTWEDGSVRYIYTHFLADLPGNAKKELLMTFKGDEDYALAMASADHEDIAVISEKEDSGCIFIDNGPLKLSVKNGSWDLFETFVYGEKTFSKSQFVGHRWREANSLF